MVLPNDVVGPLRNAVQKLAGGVDFFALDSAERHSLDEALRHLWNPGDDQQQSRERTVPIEVLALAMRDRRSAQLVEAALPRIPAASRAHIYMDEGDAQRGEAGASLPLEEAALTALKDARPTVELEPRDLPASPLSASQAPGDRASALKSEGYRAPTKGRHRDVSR